MELELVHLASPDGASAAARYVAAPSPRAAALVLPAMGVHARAYDALAGALAERGVAVLIAEHRGGESSSVRARRGVDYGYRELLADLEGQVAALQARAPGLPVNVVGHSLGGHVAVLGTPRWMRPGARLVLVASGSVHYRTWPRGSRLGMWAAAGMVGALAHTLGVFPGEALGFGGLQGRTLMVEWSRAARSGSWGELEAGVATEPLEVLAVTVEGDTWVPPAATRALVAKLSGARVRWEHLPIPGEPARLRPHFRWMRAPAELAERVVAFLAMR